MSPADLARLIAATAVAVFISSSSFAEDTSRPVDEVDTPTQLPTDPEIDPPDYEGTRKFDSRQRLTRTVLYDDRQDLAEQQRALVEAEALLERAVEAGAEQPVIDRIQAEVDRRQAEVDASREDIDRVKELVDDLSPDQVFAYNRSLNNAISSKLLDHFDFDLLQRSLGGDLDRHQINALTQALEQEARFCVKAKRFEDRAELTGSERDLAKAEQMRAKGEMQKQKFLAKISGMTIPEPIPEPRLSDALRDESRQHARKAAREVAQGEARKVARESAKRETRLAAAGRDAQMEATKAAQREAIKLARTAARDEARAQGRALGKNKKD